MTRVFPATGATPGAEPLLLSAVDLRSALTAALERSLVGPSPEGTGWLSHRPASPLVPDGGTIDPPRPIGPYSNGPGAEVLPMSPRSFYIAGVLWGTHDNTPTDDDEIEPEPGGPDNLPRGAVPEQGDLDDLDNEQLPDDVDAFGKRRSIAVTFRVPSTATAARVVISFGTYRKIAHVFDGRAFHLWERSPHASELTMSLTEAISVSVPADDLRVQVGSVVRPEADGSRLVTVWVRNDTGPDEVLHAVEAAMFQTRVAIEVDDLLPYVSKRELRDSLDLLYRDVVDLAVGHGTDVTTHAIDTGMRIQTEAMPVVEVPAMTPDVADELNVPFRVGMDDLARGNAAASAAIERLIQAYASWINSRAADLAQLPENAVGLGTAHIDRCREFLQQIRDGWALVQSDPDVRECLHDASSAMNQQRMSATAPRRPVTKDHGVVIVEGTSPHDREIEQGYWRPFQIAFVLASLPKMIDATHPQRQTVDVIWMPTGGGKTEAYLGLAAFTILWERLIATRNDVKDRTPFTKVLMRYTLRLLTVQQFLRSAALVCALEVIREAKPHRYGTLEVRIGTWVGGSTTPNKRAEAVRRLKSAAKGREEHGLLLSQCPWCGAEMGATLDGAVVGFRVVKMPNGVERVLAHCPDPGCHFSYRTETNGNRTLDRGLPVLEVDEDVYDFPPDFVIGTVDKVAMMWDQVNAQRLFGLRDGVRKCAPPALFIQDELHLINGPLGSLDGAFEVMLEMLCRVGDGGRTPVYVASTATTRNYEAQTAALYDRNAALVPPPGLTVENSFFSCVDRSRPGRVYVGVCSSGAVSNASAQGRVLGTLAHYGVVLGDFLPQDGSLSVDPYWTNVCFFSSRAALGTLTSFVETNLRAELDSLRMVSGSSSGPIGEDGRRSARRWTSRPREITATASENVTEVLDDLSITAGSPGAIDLCFATSMIEVGLDVSRLGLMTVIGQPKGSSQYIQVTGRVGRSASAPALVVDVLSTHTPRDRSHFEHFTSWHQRLYASVEGASVTPYTARALERTLPSVAAVLCRVLGGTGTIPEQIERVWPSIEEAFVNRAASFGSRAVNNVQHRLQILRERAGGGKVPAMTWLDRGTPASSFLFTFGETVPFDRPSDFWQVLTSMRSVDPDSPAFPHHPGIAPREAAADGEASGNQEIEI